MCAVHCYLSLVMRKLVFALCEHKGTDQPAHPRSLISTFVVRSLDWIIPVVSISETSSLYLASGLRRPVCVLPGHKPRRQVLSGCGSFNWYLVHFVSLLLHGNSCVCVYTNSADLNEMLHFVASDQGLHCLPRSPLLILHSWTWQVHIIWHMVYLVHDWFSV